MSFIMRIGPDPFIDAISRARLIQSRFDNNIGNTDGENKSAFEELLQITMTGTNDTGRDLSRISRGETAKLLIGEEDNLVDNMVASERSSIQFELNLAIRNKVLDAYNEIMRTQV